MRPSLPPGRPDHGAKIPLISHFRAMPPPEPARLRRTVAYARAAHRYALWALGSSGAGILLAAIALLTQ